jgi:hypothetical protein
VGLAVQVIDEALFAVDDCQADMQRLHPAV